jgi:Amt family ammonium transporter
VAGIACYWGATTLKRVLKADDSLDVFGVHGVGGIVGSIMTGLLADPLVSGLEGDVFKQMIGVLAVLVYSGLMSVVLLWLTHCIVPLRVGDAEEGMGLDLSQHGEKLGS